MTGGDWSDVERFRSSTERLVVVRRVERPTLVLGSTQADTMVDRSAAARAGVVVGRRRSGGGAVLVDPGDPLWVDLWVPRHDPAFEEDVTTAAAGVGEWWREALRRLDVRSTSVHRGRPVCSRWSGLACFAGLGPGEVSSGGRKVIGLAQWRSRQGALFHCAAYRRWRPERLPGLFRLAPTDRAALGHDLALGAAGVADLTDRSDGDPGRLLLAALLEELPVDPPWTVLEA